MLAPTCFSNYTHLIVISYFLSYCITLVGFCVFFAPYLAVTTNMYQLTAYLNYSKQKTKLFAIIFLSFLGLPPFLTFAPKFACFTEIWVYSGWTIFFLALASSFLSFALYLQVFDMLFVKRKNVSLLYANPKKELNLRAFRAYKVNVFLAVTAFWVIGGTFFFKDVVVLLGCFW